MPDESSPRSAEARLKELAGLLRTSPHLEPKAQGELADLLDELARVVATAPPASADESAHLAESTAHMSQALHQGSESALASAQRRLEASALRAETSVPLATGIVRRILAALADLGI